MGVYMSLLKKNDYIIVLFGLLILTLEWFNFKIAGVFPLEYFSIVFLFIYIITNNIRNKNKIFLFNLESSLFLSFTLYGVIVSFFSEHNKIALMNSSRYLFLFVLFSSFLNIKNRKSMTFLLTGILLIITSLSFISILKLILGFQYLHYDRFSFSYFFDPSPLNANYTAFLIGIAIFILFYLIKENRNLKKLYLILIIFFSFLLIWTFSRGTLIITFLCVFLYIHHYGYFKLSNFNIKKALLLLIVILSMIYIFKDQIISGLRLKTLSSMSGRSEIWINALNLFLKNPIFGYGVGVFRYISPRISISETQFVTHNTLLEYLVSMGILGFLPIIMLLIIGFKKNIMIFKNRKSDNLVFILYLIFIFILLLSFNMNVETNRYFIIFFALFINKNLNFEDRLIDYDM